MGTTKRVFRKNRVDPSVLRERAGWAGQVILVITILLFTLYAEPVLAHSGGRTLQIDNAATGPFFLSVWTSPEIRRTGEIHVETRIIDAEGNVDTNCLVRVNVTPLDQAGPSFSTLAAPAGSANQTEMEAAFRLDQPGRYQIDIEVVDAAGVAGKVQFETEIVPVGAFMKWLIAVQGVGSALAGLWMVRQGKSIWFDNRRSSMVAAA